MEEIRMEDAIKIEGDQPNHHQEGEEGELVKTEMQVDDPRPSTEEPPAGIKLEAEDSTMLPPPLPQPHPDALPADIEQIIASGANEPDLNEPTSNYDEVVKRAKERAGFTTIEATGVGADLRAIENEMEQGGVNRVKVEEGASGEKVVQNQDSSSDDDDEIGASSDSSSSSSSEEESATVATTSRQRKRPPRKARATSISSSLSDGDVNTLAQAPTTANEISAPEPILPTITKIPEGVELARFGTIKNVIETVVVIKADTGGDWRVLDEGTVCCWEDGEVIGTIFETFGSVVQPFYSLRFPPASPPSPEVFKESRPIYYAPAMASFVFTREIRGIKGSDASNVWDEEVADNEKEWSDDEEEAAFKRNLKAGRRSRTASLAPSTSSNSRASSVVPARPPTTNSEEYTPLQRPRNLHLIGDAPPPPSVGRKMFERDTGKKVAGGGEEAEFEFSDDEMEGPGQDKVQETPRQREISAPLESGRGRGRGRGRGGERGRGRGGGDRGRGNGRTNGGDRTQQPVSNLPSPLSLPSSPNFIFTAAPSRPVAPLPNRPSSLPPRPDFIAPETAEERRSAASASTAPNSRTNPSSAPLHHSLPAPPPLLPPTQQQFSPMNFLPTGPQTHSNQFHLPPSHQQNPYQQQHQQFNFPQQQFYPPPPLNPQFFQQQPQGPIPVQGGHFNPRFLQQRQNLQQPPQFWQGQQGNQGWYPQPPTGPQGNQQGGNWQGGGNSGR